MGTNEVFKTPGDRAVDITAEIGGVSPREIRGSRRWSDLVRLREIVTMLLRDIGYSFPQITRVLRRKDHTSIINNRNNGEKRMLTDPEFAHDFANAERQFQDQME